MATSSSSHSYGGSFRAKLWRYPGAGGWHFVDVPTRCAPRPTHAWGRTPVDAVVDGHAWKTSVWHTREGRTVLAIPKRVRGAKADGAIVAVKIAFKEL